MGKYDFQNIFELMGLEKFDDLEYLKEQVSKTSDKIRTKLLIENKNKENNFRMKAKEYDDEKNKKIHEIESLASSEKEIEAINDKYNKLIQECTKNANDFLNNIRIMHKKMDDFLNKVENSENIVNLLHTYVVLQSMLTIDKNRFNNIDHNKKLTDQEKEYKDLVIYAQNKFKTTKDIEKYLDEEIYPMQYIDVPNSNMSKNAYKGPKNKSNERNYAYNIEVNNMPKKVFDVEFESGKKIKVYCIGDFTYQHFLYPNMKPSYTDAPVNMFTVLKEDSDGNSKMYNCVMNLNIKDLKNDPEFYSNVVFSDFALRNAVENNFGYLGHVSNNNEQRVLDFNELLNMDLVKALSFAQTHKGNSNLGNCNNLLSVYAYMNDKVTKLQKSKNSKNDINKNEGGR